MRLFLIVAALLSSSVVTAQEPGVHFFKGNFEEACIQARAENKPLFIDFYTDWCKPCKAVAMYVFPSDTAAQFFNNAFINLKVDAEKDGGIALARQFAIEGYPTFIVLNPDGTVQARWAGASMRPTAGKFIEKLKSEMQRPPM